MIWNLDPEPTSSDLRGTCVPTLLTRSSLASVARTKWREAMRWKRQNRPLARCCSIILVPHSFLGRSAGRPRTASRLSLSAFASSVS